MGDAIVLMPAQFTVKVGPSLQCECQVSEATVSFDASSATIKTLCQEADLATVEKGKLTLAGYQDWTDPAGLCNFLWENALATAVFEIVGTGADTAVCTLTGNMQCRRPNFRTYGRRRGQVFPGHSVHWDSHACSYAGAVGAGRWPGRYR